MDTFATLEPGVTTAAPGSAIASILSSARDAGREHLLEHEGLALARHLDIAVPFHRFVAGSVAAEGIDLVLDQHLLLEVGRHVHDREASGGFQCGLAGFSLVWFLFAPPGSSGDGMAGDQGPPAPGPAKD